MNHINFCFLCIVFSKTRNSRNFFPHKIYHIYDTSHSLPSNLFLYRSDDDDIAMQECVPYELHKTKEINTTEGVYDECQVDPAIANTDAIYEI